MKKIAIRKLNRTQLKKEATKEVYITGKILLEFFGYSDINELATSRKDANSKKVFFHKKDFYTSDNPKSFLLSVTKENNEVRLTGFSEHLPLDIKETDSIVLEAIKKNDAIIYLFDTVKNTNLIVLQKFTANDDESNYDKSINAKGVIQFDFKSASKPKKENAYWMWDDNCSIDAFSQIVGKPIKAYFTFKGNITEKTVRIVPANDSFQKLLKAISNSNRSVETQNKDLYFIEESTGSEWKTLVNKTVCLEVQYCGTYIVVSDRDDKSFIYFGGDLN